jgi:hypothetical protein
MFFYGENFPLQVSFSVYFCHSILNSSLVSDTEDDLDGTGVASIVKSYQAAASNPPQAENIFNVDKIVGERLQRGNVIYLFIYTVDNLFIYQCRFIY